jgi:hypothetical protein
MSGNRNHWFLYFLKAILLLFQNAVLIYLLQNTVGIYQSCCFFLQELGVSNSSYSLKNQQQLNPIFNDRGKKVHMSDIEKFITKLRNEWKVQHTDN